MGIMNGTQSAGRRWLVGLLMLGMGLALAGCVRLLEPRQSDIQYYVLGTPDANIETMQQHDTTHIALGLRRVRIADYLDSPALVTRRGAHAIRFAEFHRWGEDLARAINRTVAGVHYPADNAAGAALGLALGDHLAACGDTAVKPSAWLFDGRQYKPGLEFHVRTMADLVGKSPLEEPVEALPEDRPIAYVLDRPGPVADPLFADLWAAARQEMHVATQFVHGESR